MSVGSERGSSSWHCLQFSKLSHGMSLLCKRHTMLPRQRLPNGVERGARPYRLMKRPTILGCWHISQPRRGLVAQGLSPSVGGLSLCCTRQLSGVSVFSCREAGGNTFLPAKPPSCHANRHSLTPGGDWNCAAEDLDLVGHQLGTRQHGFQSGLLPFQQALSLQDAFRCLHRCLQARDFTHTATNNASSARIDRWLVSDSLLPKISHRPHLVRALWSSSHSVTCQCTSPGLW